MNSMFDPDVFMGTNFDDAPDDKYTPCPQDIYPAVVKEVKPPRQVGDSVVMDILWTIQAPEELHQKLGREEIVVKQSLFLDLTPTGGLAMGPNQNISLGKLLKALGIHGTWSPLMLQGKPAAVFVTHRADKTDPSTIYDEIRRVAKMEQYEALAAARHEDAA